MRLAEKLELKWYNIKTEQDVIFTKNDGLHSFRVGGAQALALQGVSPQYIMAKGRWKCYDSVARYVSIPAQIKELDSWYMSKPLNPANINQKYREYTASGKTTLDLQWGD